MQEKGYAEEEIKAVVERLVELELLNDRVFAKKYLRYQLQIKPQGRYRIKGKLIQLAIPEELVREALSDYDADQELTQAQQAAEDWLERKGNLPTEEKRGKLARFLASRGFGWETTKKILDRIF